MLRLLLIALVASGAAWAEIDPYAAFETVVLPNGLTVVYAPSPGAQRMGVWVVVEAGTLEEKSATGVAHLTEHVLFRDPSLGGRSYLDILRREGASDTNGHTGADRTTYEASVAPERGEWLLQTMVKWFSHTDFDAGEVEKAKKEIDLELTTRSMLASPLADNLGRIFKTEFGIETGGSHTTFELSRIARATHGLNERSVASFYRAFYHPRNMTLYLLGKFDPPQARRAVEATFGHLPKDERGRRKEAAPKPRAKPYFVSSPSSGANFIVLGTKYWNISAPQELVLRAYVDDLALRLMEKLRSQNAQTYTVSPVIHGDTRRFGIAEISLETTKQDYADNYDYISELIDTETLDGKLTGVDLHRIRELTERNLSLPPDIPGLARAAITFHDFQVSHQTHETPLSIFRRIRDDEFRRALYDLFQPERRFTMLREPPLFFLGEGNVLELSLLLYALFIARTSWRRKFDESSRIVYTEKVRGGAVGKLVFAMELFGKLLVLVLGQMFADKLQDGYFYFRGAVFFIRYFEHSLWQLAFWLWVFRGFSYRPRRILLKEKGLIIQSRLYRAWLYPWSKIQRVEVISVGAAANRRKRGTVFAHYSMWRNGVWIETETGASFYLGFADPEKTAAEMRALIAPAPVDNDATGVFDMKAFVAK